MVANILPVAPLPRPWVKRSNLTFAEHGHVSYQIKGNREMQQYGNKYFASSPALPPPDPGGQMVEIIIQLF